MHDCESAFKRALNMLSDAEFNFNGNRYNTSINRSYYAVFYATKDLLFKKGIESKKHSGNIQNFGKEYVAKGDFDPKIAKILSQLEVDRINMDYDTDFNASKFRAKQDLDNANLFISECKKFL
ncbi:HEPN domain-containing protein [Methanobrevibacter filiformis]|uniref:HEPN domain-containing protein n=1 Tax=Methanobrevibacter filiformis TaxID=55758 RepID=UPI00082D4B11|nr:HEPN domain-containing protein [Methanobrevibacter filiformis]